MSACPKCGAKLRYKDRYCAGTYSCTARAKCSGCGALITEIRFLIDENPKRGQSAAKLAQKLAAEGASGRMAAQVAAEIQGLGQAEG